MTGAGRATGELLTPELTASDVRATMSVLFPDLQHRWDLPLRDYASAAYTISETVPQRPIREDARERLLNTLEGAALRGGATRSEAAEARDQLGKVPVLQTGPHCHLLIEPDAFYTHHFSVMGLRSRGLRWHHWYGCSTVKLIERARKGPGWLQVGGSSVNVFGLPRRVMDRLSVCGIRDEPMRFKLSTPTAPRASAVDVLAGMLPTSSFVSAADAIKAANVGLWQSCMDDDIRLQQFDDFDVGDLIADHLGDPGSWLASHLCEPDGFGAALLACLSDVEEGPWRGWIRRTTDLFWGLQDGSLFPLRLHEGALEAHGDPGPIVRFDARSLSLALRRRQIVPSLLMTFLVISVLPAVRVLGGCRQIVYYPLMRHVIAAALHRCGFHRLRTSLAADNDPGIWGHRVLKPADGCPLSDVAALNSKERLALFGNATLKEASGDMASFSRDPLWGTVRALLRKGTIDPLSASWLSAPGI